jgi:hypothetical protein
LKRVIGKPRICRRFTRMSTDRERAGISPRRRGGKRMIGGRTSVHFVPGRFPERGLANTCWSIICA